MKKRFFSILLSLCMVLMLFPVTAFAEDPSGSITINGPDKVCAKQDYEFTVTAAGGVTLDKEFGYDLGGMGSGVDLTIDEDGVGHGVLSAELFNQATNGFDVRAHGMTEDGKTVSTTKHVEVSPEHIYEDGVCGCGAVLTYIVEYDGGAEFGLYADVKTHGKDLTLSSETFKRAGYIQTGWQGSDGNFYELGGVYSTDEDVTMYAVWDKSITLSVPFTTTVKLGGSVAPGKTTFDLAVVDANASEETYKDVTVSGSVTTNGAGDYEGILTLTGPSRQLWDMLSEGAFVQQVDADEEGWTYDDTVWGLSLEEKEIVALASTDDAAPAYSVQVYTTKVEDSDNGPYYQINYTDPQDKMRFTNIYTKSTTEPTETTKPTSNTPTTNATTSVQTGDNSNLMLWLVLLAVSAAGVISTGVYSRRRRSSRTK
ncbi:hypothetical protein ACQRBH_08180 [Bariatricus sp. SGI.161]|uniref:hypothetical protein n=1 Tax=Bariatricus sp. SGI.161 TaxID=3420550 RepID=UPI003D05A90E